MTYIENPKTKGSGIYCAIPQSYQKCAKACPDCFFQGGRSYLEPLSENLPNIPTRTIINNYVIRVNDGLDSGQDIDQVVMETRDYPNKFYNTADPIAAVLLSAWGPTVLTINPGEMTDRDFFKPNPQLHNLMFVRFRANTWNKELLFRAANAWYEVGVPLVITYMRYYDKGAIPRPHSLHYEKKEHILNPSWAVDSSAWCDIYRPYQNVSLVSTCGIGPHTHGCKSCGVCLREYWRCRA